MIDQIDVSSIPCFTHSNLEPIPLKEINFIFGSNGSGKSSIAIGLQNEKSGLDPNMRILLYNRKFREDVIAKGDSLKGLLTVGADAVNAQKTIENKRKELAQANRNLQGVLTKISNPDKSLPGHREIQEKSKTAIGETVWRRSKDAKQQHRAKLFPGLVGKKQNLINELFPNIINFDEAKSPEEEPSLTEVYDRFSRIQEAKGDRIDGIALDYSQLHSDINGVNRLLETEIINQGDTEYAKSITLLDANSWIESGITLLERSKPHCPFCHQSLDAGLINDIQAAFSKEYKGHLAELNTHLETINSDLEAINTIDNLISELEIVETADISAKLQALRSKLNEIKQFLENKIEAPELVLGTVVLDSQKAEFFAELQSLKQSIEKINEDIDNSDQLQSELITQAKKSLIADCWDEIKAEVETFNSSEKALTGLGDQVERLNEKIAKLNTEIDEASKKVRNSKISLDEINRMIAYLVGDSFKLEPASGEEVGNYRVVRPNGKPVDDSLSEGEQQLVAFLYFISTVWNIGKMGSDIPESSAVVVIDDPMSSLDSDLMFGVSSLIIDLIDGMGRKEYSISQLICLTHNTTFYNNITFRFNQSTDRFQHLLINKKQFGHNTLELSDNSPVLSSYDSLWESVRQAQNAQYSDTTGLANIMRRILENYFQAGWSLKQLPKLEGANRQEQILVNSLVSWANSGSHNLLDSLEISGPNVDASTYLRVFKLIFHQTGQEGHYNMMMKIN